LRGPSAKSAPVDQDLARAQEYSNRPTELATPPGVLLPYCDAMLMDNEIAGYLKEEPLVSSLGFPCKVFSPRTLPHFMNYLDEIEGAATPEHLKKVEEVCGVDWPQPSRRFTPQSNRRSRPISRPGVRGCGPDRSRWGGEVPIPLA